MGERVRVRGKYSGFWLKRFEQLFRLELFERLKRLKRFFKERRFLCHYLLGQGIRGWMGGGGEMKYTKFQTHVINKLKERKSLLLVAPTGLGKTLAVTGEIPDGFCKMVYAVPLRSLGKGIQKEISHLNRNGKQIPAVIHHGDIQESRLFGEEVVITTYDQVVCAVPGLPLSLPLKAGHAVAGALLMSRLILDETHLAWSIFDKALSILLAIINFKQKLGFQKVLLTATLPKKVVEIICERLNIELVIVGEG